MSQPPTKEGLLELLKRKKFEKEAEDLKDGRTSFDEWMDYPQELLERLYKLDGWVKTKIYSGVDGIRTTDHFVHRCFQ
ncbi:hypothetical protein MP638_000803 [Amoeboaphelidium occidentale]|nr:hypothetical protein MP638_000803 [Amoeboaphelidium occidentale]